MTDKKKKEEEEALAGGCGCLILLALAIWWCSGWAGCEDTTKKTGTQKVNTIPPGHRRDTRLDTQFGTTQKTEAVREMEDGTTSKWESQFEKVKK